MSFWGFSNDDKKGGGAFGDCGAFSISPSAGGSGAFADCGAYSTKPSSGGSWAHGVDPHGHVNKVQLPFCNHGERLGSHWQSSWSSSGSGGFHQAPKSNFYSSNNQSSSLYSTPKNYYGSSSRTTNLYGAPSNPFGGKPSSSSLAYSTDGVYGRGKRTVMTPEPWFPGKRRR